MVNDLFGDDDLDPVDPGGDRRIPVGATLVGQSRAQFSSCASYRYVLARRWMSGPQVLWVMLNPSTADMAHNDPTVHRCQQFAAAWRYGGLIVCNLFGLRATSPAALAEAQDPVGPDNDCAIAREADRSACNGDLVVCAWGASGPKTGRGEAVLALLQQAGVSLYALGWTRKGEPAHPLYWPATARPESWG